MPMNLICTGARRAAIAPSRNNRERSKAWAAWAARWGIATLIALASVVSRAASPADTCANSASHGMAPLVLQSVTRDVWRVAVDTDEANPHNGGWVTQPVVVRDGARLWLIGSGPTPAQGLRLRCAISAAIHREVTDVINTRAHPELALANLAFTGARLWALDDVAAAMAQRCPQCLDRLRQRLSESERDDDAGSATRRSQTVATDEARGIGEQIANGADRQGSPLRSTHDPAVSLHPVTIRVPDHRLHGDAGTLGPFQWWAVERAAGERTLLLRHRRSGWLIAQGLVWVGGVPNLRETALDEMTAGLERLLTLAAQPDVKGLLGEQGAPGSAADVVDHLEYLAQLRRRTEQALDRGEVEGAHPIEFPAYAGRPGYEAYHALNRQRVWRALERKLFD